MTILSLVRGIGVVLLIVATGVMAAVAFIMLKMIGLFLGLLGVVWFIWALLIHSFKRDKK